MVDQPAPTAPTLKRCSRSNHMESMEMFVGVNGSETKICRTHREKDREYQKKVN